LLTTFGNPLWKVRDVKRFFDRHRNAVQWSPALAAGEGGIGGEGALASGVNLPSDDRIEGRVMPLGAGEVEVEQFDTPHAPVADLV
jgi:hypothetical protein